MPIIIIIFWAWPRKCNEDIFILFFKYSTKNYFTKVYVLLISCQILLVILKNSPLPPPPKKEFFNGLIKNITYI